MVLWPARCLWLPENEMRHLFVCNIQTGRAVGREKEAKGRAVEAIQVGVRLDLCGHLEEKLQNLYSREGAVHVAMSEGVLTSEVSRWGSSGG